MRKWIGIPLALLLLAGLLPSAWANNELHTGGRLFFPLWDVSTANRLTFIVVTREAQNEGSGISSTRVGTAIDGISTIITKFRITGTPGNCLPRGANGSSTNVNRSDLGGTATSPVFVDDVHFEYYGKSCNSNDEIVHMSCADVDIFVLASPNNAFNKPRRAFAGVAADGRGALDVHFTTNRPLSGTTSRVARKEEDSLMGHAIISDVAEGWALVYPAAAAKSTRCYYCDFIDGSQGGTKVGYENYPMEVFLPFALADGFDLVPSAPAFPLRNILSLWGPSLLPAGSLNNTSMNIFFTWWDGRERAFSGSVIKHSVIRPLGGTEIAGLDPPLDGAGFTVGNFVCGHAPIPGNAENDGFPRVAGTSATTCGVPSTADTTDPSDNFESSGDVNITGHSIQNSIPVGWWRFLLEPDNNAPSPFTGNAVFAHSGRGLVGVVESYTPGASANAVGDATRLWHKDPCEIAQSAASLGPPHLRDRSPNMTGSRVSLFNILSYQAQRYVCGFTTNVTNPTGLGGLFAFPDP